MVLRQLVESDIGGMLEWMHDREINQYFAFNAATYSEKEAKEFIETAQRQRADRTNFHWAITKDGNEYLGTISLKNVNFINKNAEYAICLRKNAQGMGYGVEATKEVIRYAKEELHLHKIYLNVLENNFKAIKMYEKCGFVYEGTSKDHVKVADHYVTLKWYGMVFS